MCPSNNVKDMLSEGVAVAFHGVSTVCVDVWKMKN